MSLSWLDRLSLFVHPQRIVLERKPWRGPLERIVRPVPAAIDGASEWQTALDTATTVLPANRGGRLNIVIANPFVRYVLLPWSEAVLGDKARLAVARALLQNRLGEQLADYDIALDRASYGRNSLGAAIPRGLLDGLRQLARQNRLRLDRLQPQLAHELLKHRRGPNDGCLAFADDGWLTLVGYRDGDYCLLRNQRTAADPAQAQNELLGLLAIEASAVNPKKLQIFANAPWPATLGEWQIDCQPPHFPEPAHA